MCLICDGMTKKEYWAMLRNEILTRGWCLVSVEGDGPRNPAFSYTAGLSRCDHAEIIVFGMHPECAREAIEPVAEAVLAGRRFDEGDDLSPLYPHPERAELLRFPDSSTHLFYANDMYRAAGRPPVPALHLFWPSQEPLLGRSA
jgi:hypothetical protein